MPSAKPDQEDRIPLQALGGVQRCQGDALHDRWVACVGALTELGKQGAQVQRRPLRHFLIDEFGERAQRLPPLTGPGARRRFGGETQWFEDGAHDVG